MNKNVVALSKGNLKEMGFMNGHFCYTLWYKNIDLSFMCLCMLSLAILLYEPHNHIAIII